MLNISKIVKDIFPILLPFIILFIIFILFANIRKKGED